MQNAIQHILNIETNIGNDGVSLFGISGIRDLVFGDAACHHFLTENLLIASIDSGAMVPTFVVCAAVFSLVYWVAVMMATDDLEQGNEWRFDVSRINDLRRSDTIYRWFQPIIQAFARFNRAAFQGQLPTIDREIKAAGLPRSWLPEEYLGKLEFIACLMSPLIAYCCIGWMGAAGIIMAFFLTILLAFLLRRGLALKAFKRLTAIKRRMPFMLDLMTLLMEAGTTFLHALEQGVTEYEGHPLSQEFKRVLTDMNLGKTRRQSFEAMKERLQDDEITSIIGSIIQAEELGTPLSAVFRTQADVLRLKRSQRAEAIAGEAGVKMLLPGVMVMAATVIVIIGPFAINFLIFGFNLD
ncbi:MAG: type II secretion system F family protein [Mariniblastus sp.]